MLYAKSGNTELVFNDEFAVKPEEVERILKRIGRIAYPSYERKARAQMEAMKEGKKDKLGGGDGVG
jgi:hypothetical protein